MAELVLGTNNAFALRNWPEPRSWARLVREEFELASVQFSFDLLDPTLPEPDRSAMCAEVLEAVRHYDLSLTSTFTGLLVYAQNMLAHPSLVMRSQARRWYCAALETTSKLSVGTTGGHMATMSLADFADSQRRTYLRNSVVEAVQDLTRMASALGQSLVLWELMPSPREFPHTPDEAVELLQWVNEDAAVPVRLCFDLGHCNSFDAAAPADPHEWLQRLLPWTPVVHLQQTDGQADRHWPFTPEHASVGIIDPRRVIEIARESPLDRIELLFEIAHPFDTPAAQIVDDHKRSVEA